MAMKRFEFKKAYEEIEVVGEVYRISLNDDDRKNYSDHLIGFYESLDKAQKVDPKTITRDDSLKLEEEIKQSTLKTLDIFFGEGSGEKLYEASGRQTDELFDFIYEVAEMIQARRQEKANRYLKKKKGK
ncbi:hypothetical protein [Metabacillus sp. FJAT-53654]|uniref:Uncharacterized protein n=1 Tax=Metabacillus rhizosphaerae TaxID=3117747 RepID=A0ABZ2MZF7_9BACI